MKKALNNDDGIYFYKWALRSRYTELKALIGVKCDSR